MCALNRLADSIFSMAPAACFNSRALSSSWGVLRGVPYRFFASSLYLSAKILICTLVKEVYEQVVSEIK